MSFPKCSCATSTVDKCWNIDQQHSKQQSRCFFVADCALRVSTNNKTVAWQNGTHSTFASFRITVSRHSVAGARNALAKTRASTHSVVSWCTSLQRTTPIQRFFHSQFYLHHYLWSEKYANSAIWVLQSVHPNVAIKTRNSTEKWLVLANATWYMQAIHKHKPELSITIYSSAIFSFDIEPIIHSFIQFISGNMAHKNTQNIHRDRQRYAKTQKIQ